MEFALSHDSEPVEVTTVPRQRALRRLERAEGVADAHAFLEEADRQWDADNRGWAIEYPGPNSEAPEHVR